MARAKKEEVEAEASIQPEVEMPVQVLDTMAVQLKNGETHIGTLVKINGQDHVKIQKDDHEFLVHKSLLGDWYEV